MAISLDEAAGALAAQRWIFAKTMPQWPHWYCLRKNWTVETAFEAVVQFIRDNGYREKFSGSGNWFTRFDLNGHKYWSMGAPLPKTILINRAEIDAPALYDEIAQGYDALWATPEADAENRAALDLMGYSGGSILDIGCGTGLLLDYIEFNSGEYLGIDPSRGMLARLREKHPDAETICTTLEAFWTPRRFDMIAGLFASPSYISPLALAGLPALLKPGGRYFLMFYAPGYEPETHRRLFGRSLPFHRPVRLGGREDRLGNFVCVSGP